MDRTEVEIRQEEIKEAKEEDKLIEKNQTEELQMWKELSVSFVVNCFIVVLLIQMLIQLGYNTMTEHCLASFAGPKLKDDGNNGNMAENHYIRLKTYSLHTDTVVLSIARMLRHDVYFGAYHCFVFSFTLLLHLWFSSLLLHCFFSATTLFYSSCFCFFLLLFPKLEVFLKI